MKKLRILSILLLTLAVNSVAANAKLTFKNPITGLEVTNEEGKDNNFNEIKPIQNGWAQDKLGYSYYYKNGIMQIGWLQVDGSWYYFNENGMMATCQYVGDNSGSEAQIHKYYLGSDGKWQENNVVETEPKYGAIAVTKHHWLSKYYLWCHSKVTFKYSEEDDDWDITKYSTIKELKDEYPEDFKKYLQAAQPLDKGKDGEERTFAVHVYLGKIVYPHKIL